ncbi:MAG: DinB family protein [Bryobacterales bacterium]|nr:DinB family protein [Bryobacterales bacterium]
MALPARAEGRKVNPEIERLLYQIDVIVEDASGLVDKISNEQFNWSPAPGKWSIASAFDHLNVSNGLMLATCSAAVTKARSDGRLSEGPFTYGFLSRWFYRAIQPPVRNRYSAPRNLQPRITASTPATIEQVAGEFVSTHERFKQVLLSADGIDLSAIKVQSPASSFFKYELGMAFWIMCGHDRRHLWQARNVRNHANFPA